MWPAAHTGHLSLSLPWPPAPQASRTATANLPFRPSIHPSSLRALHASSPCSETIAGSLVPWEQSLTPGVHGGPQRFPTHVSQDSASGILPSNLVDPLPWNVAGSQAEATPRTHLPDSQDGSGSNPCWTPAQRHLPLRSSEDLQAERGSAVACPSLALSAVDAHPRRVCTALPNGRQGCRGCEHHTGPYSALPGLHVPTEAMPHTMTPQQGSLPA